MRSLHSHRVPDRLGSVQFRAITRQTDKVKTMPVAAQRLPHLRGLVVGGIVMNQEHLLATVATGQAIEKLGVTGPLEDLAMLVVKLGSVKIHRPKNLLRVALARGRNERLVATSGPGL